MGEIMRSFFSVCRRLNAAIDGVLSALSLSILPHHPKIDPLESLESRTLLAAITWDGGAGTANWIDANNWSNNAIPTASDDVTIDIGGSDPTILLASGARAVHSLVCNEILHITGGSLTVSTTATISQPLTLSGYGSIIGGTWSGAGGITASDGTLNGVTLNCAATITGSVDVSNGLTVNNTLTLNGASGYAYLNFSATQTLGGTGTIVFASANDSGIYLRGNGSLTQLTLGSGLMINAQKNGYFTAYTDGDMVINDATVVVEGATTGLDLRGRNINRGTYRMIDDGTVTVAGTLLFDNAGTFDSVDGTFAITGTLDNTGKTLAMTAATGSVTLQSWGKILGGEISCAGGAELIIDDGTLAGVTLSSDVYVKESQWLNVYDGLKINSGVTFHIQTSNNSGAVSFIGTQSIIGQGQISFDASVGVGEGTIYSKGSAVVTIGPGITIVANHTGNMTVNGANDTWINQGTIRADGKDVTLTFEGKNWINQGRLEARNNATLELDGSFTTAGLGTFDGTDGTILIAGTLDNTGNILTLNSTTGPLTVGSYYGTIKGGTLATADGTQFYSAGGTFDGVTLNGNATASHVDFGTGMFIANGMVLNGVITVLSGGSSNLTFEGTQTLSGNGEILLTGAGNPILYTRDGSEIVTITIGPDITLRAINDAEVYPYTTKDFFVIQGSIEVDSGATFTLTSRVSIDLAANASLSIQPGGELKLENDLAGDTVNHSAFKALGTLNLTGGTSQTPSLLEAFSADQGAVSAGYKDNFAFNSIVMEMGTYARLVNNADNASGVGAEAVYANSLVVPSSATLDLNGLHLYARVTKISGSVINGTITTVPDGGAIPINSSSIGSISSSGQIDNWTFYGRAGRNITVSINPSATGTLPAISPTLNYASIEILDPQNNVVSSQEGDVSGAVVSISDFTLPATGTYTLRVKATAAHSANIGSYTIALWDATPTTNKLVLNQNATGRIESPFSVNRWTFTAAAGQQIQLQLANSDNPNLAFKLTGPNDFTGFIDQVGNSDFVTLPVSGVYTLSAYSLSSAYNIPFTFRLAETAVADLTLGVPANGTFVGAGQAKLFRLSLANAAPLRFILDSAGAQDHTEFYVGFGQPPTRANYAFSSVTGPDQDLTVPLAAAGTWYALVYCAYAQSDSAYTLAASSSNVMLNNVSPARVGNSSPVTLTLTGSGFDATTAVQLINGDNTINSVSLSHDSFTQLTATFASGIPAGSYKVKVTRGDAASAEIANGLTLVSGGHSDLQTQIILPEVLGYHQLNTIYIQYTNAGDVAMPAPLLVLNVTQNGQQGAFLTLDQNILNSGYWTSAMPAGFSHDIKFLASGQTPGVLLPGESYKVPVYWAGWQQPWNMDYPGFDFTLTPIYTDDTQAINWSSIKDSLRPDGISADAWTPIFSNATSSLPTWGAYIGMLDDNASYLGRLGQRVVDVSELWNYELMQSNAFGFLDPIAVATDDVVESPGIPLSFSRTFDPSITGRTHLGRLGRGWSDNWDYSLSQSSDGTVVVRSPGGSLRMFQPDVRGGYLASTGDFGRLVEVTANVFTLTEPDGTIHAFNSDGTLDYVADAAGNRIDCGYDSGRLSSLSNLSSHTSITIEYNAFGRIFALVDTSGRSALYTYDASGEHLLSVHAYDRKTTGYAYNTTAGSPKIHALTEIDLPGGAARLFTYDNQGRLAGSSLNVTDEVETYSYDSAGTFSLTDAAGHTRSVFFDNFGLPVKYADALGNAVLIAYDSAHQATSITDPAGRSYTARYDAHGNLTAYTDAMGNTTQYAYSSVFNRLASVTDAKGNLTRYKYDNSGNLTAVTYADGSAVSYTVDDAGQVTHSTNARGHATSYTYDDAGRPLTITYADASQTAFTYAPNGNLLTMTDKTGTTSYTYENDLLKRIDYPNGLWIAYTYNAAGKISSRTGNDSHIVNYHYDSAGRLHDLTGENNALIVLYDYDNVGRLSKSTFGNETFADYVYDDAGRILSLVNHTSNNTVISSFEYTYDSRSRRTSMTTLDGVWTYSYDDLGQLTHAVFASSNIEIDDQDLAYAYDAMGNRTQTLLNGVTTLYTTNAMNQYTFIGDTQYVYDADGNLTQTLAPSGTTQYEYDDENQLIELANAHGSWQYAYNGLNQLVSSDFNGATTRYLVEPYGIGNTIGAFNGTTLITDYVHGLGLASSWNASGNASFYATDALGSISNITNAAGAVTDSYSYTPFGSILSSTLGGDNTLQFVGGRGVTFQSNGLSSMRRRFYDPTAGRFLSVDPINAPGANAYAYVVNQPTSFIDPAGLKPNFGGSSYGDGDDNSSSGDKNAGTHHGKKWQDFGGNNNNNNSSDNSSSSGWDWSHPFDSIGRAINSWFGNDGANTNNAGGNGASSKSAGSRDPNEKSGPAGYGASGFIQPGSLMPYRIDFENDATASSPAQYVDILDTLSPNLNWNTFAFTQFGFGDQIYTLSIPTQHVETSLSMTYNGSTFDVQIKGDIDLGTGVVRVQFISIDPDTSLPPAGQIGFLPPEDGTGRGMGYFTFSVNAKNDLTTGTTLRNIAQIQFDRGEIIATDQVAPHDPAQGVDPTKQCLNTIDAVAPVSHVKTLAGITQTAAFTVAWSASDDANGSGAGLYNVYVSDNGGAFTLWKSATSALSAKYPGVDGHTYAFYSVATDHAGNAESSKLAAETSTRIKLPPTLQFKAATYSVSEKTKTITLTVTRTGDTTKAVTVKYATVSGGTAKAGTDYKTTSGILKFTAGQTSKTFTLSILDDAVAEPNKTVKLALSSPTGGAVLGAVNKTTLTILDNDDKTPPTAALVKPAAPIKTAATYRFSVIYTDNILVKASTLGTGDILITGPKGYSQIATLVSFKPTADAKSITALYQIPAPGGAWDKTDNGTYTFTLQSNQVTDQSGKIAAKKILGTPKVSLT